MHDVPEEGGADGVLVPVRGHLLRRRAPLLGDPGQNFRKGRIASVDKRPLITLPCRLTARPTALALASCRRVPEPSPPCRRVPSRFCLALDRRAPTSRLALAATSRCLVRIRRGDD